MHNTAFYVNIRSVFDSEERRRSLLLAELQSMKVSQVFNLGKTQYELDFIDIDPDYDTPLFIDPYLLSKRNDLWSIDASRTVRSFFQHLIALLHSQDIGHARRIFSYLGEPNETCLGLSRGSPQGRGVGMVDMGNIFDSLLRSRAVQEGIVEDIEDCRIFVDGVDKDKISDMTTNIIRGHLIEYTQKQCDLWGIPMVDNVPSGFVWRRADREWENFYTRTLIVNGKRILLVPKAVSSFVKKYTAQQYHQHFVLNFLQNEHLRMDTILVQRRTRKDGSERRYVTKRSIEEDSAPLSKDFLAKFTQAHPEVFAQFKEQAAKSEPVVSNEELTDDDLGEIIDYLIASLVSTPKGSDAATRYHRLAVGILELIFYPSLMSPQIEREIHGGRKRIDITFDNSASDGFFYRLHDTFKTPSQFVFVECKNYSREVANPELDQLAGRFSLNRGKFGLLLCRSIDNLSVFLARCSDTYKDDRGVIIPIIDEDLIFILNSIKSGSTQAGDEFLTNRFREIALR